jgi:hypothetical protein
MAFSFHFYLFIKSKKKLKKRKTSKRAKNQKRFFYVYLTNKKGLLFVFFEKFKGFNKKIMSDRVGSNRVTWQLLYP